MQDNRKLKNVLLRGGKAQSLKISLKFEKNESTDRTMDELVCGFYTLIDSECVCIKSSDTTISTVILYSERYKRI